VLTKKEVTLAGQKFVVSEITIGLMLPILPRLQGADAQQAQLDMMKACIFIDDKPIGEDVMNIGLSTYLELAKEVMMVNGLEVSEVGKNLPLTNKPSTQ